MTVEIIQGDCIDILPRYEGKADLIVTSPPYDDLREYGGHNSNFDFEATAVLLCDALKPGGVLCWNVQDGQREGNFTLTSFRQALMFQDLGLLCREKLVTERVNPRIRGHRCYLRCVENVFVFTKGPDITFNPISDRPNVGVGVRKCEPAGRNGDSKATVAVRTANVERSGTRCEVWRYSTGLYHTAPDAPEAHDVHPAMMPLKLAQDLIRSYTNEGDLVLDPFVGSGTTAVAAKYLLRDCVGIDINAEYCAFARERLAQDVLL